MGEAFRCDTCGEFYDGEPAKTLYERDFTSYNETVYTEFITLCDACLANIKPEDSR